MKKKHFKLVLPVIGSFSVLIFGVSAAASIVNAPLIASSSYSEPINMMLIGLGFIGLGKAMR